MVKPSHLVLPYETKRWGENYDSVLPELDSDDFRESGYDNKVGFYFGLGYTYQRISLIGKIGFYSDVYYENGYNSIMGLHHITRTGHDYLLIGGSLNIKANKWLSFTSGYNNFSKFSLGMNFRYSKY